MLRAEWILFIKGDRLAFKKIYDTYADDLFSFGMSIYPDKEMILDCIHDLFVNMYGNLRIARDVNVKHYLFVSLRRSILRKKKKNDVWTDIGEYIPEDAQEHFVLKSVEEEIILAEISKNNSHLILKTLEKLPKRQREIIHLRYYMNFSYEEISQIMDVNVATCRTLSYRAISLLRKHLSPLAQLGFYLFFLK